MDPDAAFLRAIRRTPADDAPRLIWADYLDESPAASDHARAALVRTQCALARLPTDNPAHAALSQREADLLAAHQAEWAAGIAGLVAAFEFRRGLLDSVTMTGREFRRHAHELFRLAPIRRVRLTEPLGDLDALAACPQLAKLRELDLSGADLGNAGISTLAASPYVANLRSVELGFTGAGDGSAPALAAAPWAKLAELGLGGNRRLGTSAVEQLTRAPWFAAIRSLDLADNTIGPDAIARLTPFKLQSLKLAHNPLGDDGTRLFVASPLYARLVRADARLDLAGVGLGATGAGAIAHAAPSAALTSLDLSLNDLGDAGVTRLAEGHFDRLAHLSLAKVGVTDRGSRRLAQSHLMPKLRTLDLSGNRMTQSGLNLLNERRRETGTRVETAGNFAANTDDPPEPLTESVNRVLAALSPGAGRTLSGYTERTLPPPRGPR